MTYTALCHHLPSLFLAAVAAAASAFAADAAFSRCSRVSDPNIPAEEAALFAEFLLANPMRRNKIETWQNQPLFTMEDTTFTAVEVEVDLNLRGTLVTMMYIGKHYFAYNTFAYTVRLQELTRAFNSFVYTSFALNNRPDVGCVYALLSTATRPGDLRGKKLPPACKHLVLVFEWWRCLRMENCCSCSSVKSLAPWCSH